MERGHQQSESPGLCEKGCGFFGTAANKNMCSKCYQDYVIEKAFANLSLKESDTTTTEKRRESISTCVDSGLSSESVGVKADSGVKNRCSSCNKKVGLTGFKCRCGATFCSSHRYPEKHTCTFDYKGLAREAIAKANPVVNADKVDMF